MLGSISTLVENALSNPTLTELAPLPSLRAEKFVEMLVSNTDAAKPDLGLAFADFIELWAASEMQQIGSPGRLPLALGDVQGTVKDESDGL